MTTILLVGQVVWEKIPSMVRGFVLAIVLMSFYIGLMYLTGVDDPKVVRP